MVFTPLDENNVRLEFDDSEVDFLKVDMNRRILGYRGIIKIKGKKFDVYGQSCGLPGCGCDAMIKEVI